jgi:hypothetical protein
MHGEMRGFAAALLFSGGRAHFSLQAIICEPKIKKK